MSSAPLPSLDEADDYRIAIPVGPTFLARGRSGAAALLVPLTKIGGAVGRFGGGFALTSVPRVAFQHAGRRWEQPAAVLECTDQNLVDAFLVLVTDIGRRLIASAEGVTWQNILACVEEWQALLGRRATLSVEEQLGLWGELWVISRAGEADALVAAWRGPEGQPIDFFHDGIGLEVKVSRRPHVHHVSQTQVDFPRGDYLSYFLSIWVDVDPVRGLSLSELVDRLLNSVSDPGAFLKQLADAGYSPHERAAYATRFVPLEAPLWFRSESIPRVHAIDPGVSHLRYMVMLDVDACVTRDQVTHLWRHFCGKSPGDQPLGLT